MISPIVLNLFNLPYLRQNNPQFLYFQDTFLKIHHWFYKNYKTDHVQGFQNFFLLD